VDSRAAMDAVAKNKEAFPCRELNPSRPPRSLVTTLTELLRRHYCKLKVVPVLLIEHHAMKAYWGSGVIAPLIP
jgi:hypothetical protein